jgi:hypothetical protein
MRGRRPGPHSSQMSIPKCQGQNADAV